MRHIPSRRLSQLNAGVGDEEIRRASGDCRGRSGNDIEHAAMDDHHHRLAGMDGGQGSKLGGHPGVHLAQAFAGLEGVVRLPRLEGGVAPGMAGLASS